MQYVTLKVLGHGFGKIGCDIRKSSVACRAYGTGTFHRGTSKIRYKFSGLSHPKVQYIYSTFMYIRSQLSAVESTRPAPEE